jgi:hypothetical protein
MDFFRRMRDAVAFGKFDEFRKRWEAVLTSKPETEEETI